MAKAAHNPEYLHGLQGVRKRLRLAIASINHRTGIGVMEGGLIIQAAAQEKCPIVTGNLRASAYTTPYKGMTGAPCVEIGFTAIYAHVVHENPRSGTLGQPHSEVGEWKFLEKAIDQKGPEVLDRIRRRAAV